MTTLTAPCPGCGRDVTREQPTGDLAPWLAEKLSAIRVWCSACCDAADQADGVALARADYRMRLGVSGVPRGAVTSATFTPAQSALVDSWVGDGGTLVLTGPVGTGKTTLAARCALSLLEAGSRVRWANVPGLLLDLGRSFDDMERQAALDALTGRGPLVLDDLDKARPSEYAAECLQSAIDRRVQAGARLLVTTNLSVSEVAKRWPQPAGQAIASRLAQGRVVQITGRDRRLDRGRG